MKLSDYVIQFLVDQGLCHIFLLPGGACMHLADSVGKRPELDYVCCLHEQSCAFAAEAYGEYAGNFGCALVTAGPGGTNAITGVACAWIESSPVIFISGQAKRADLISSRSLPVRSLGQQEVDIVSIVKPLTKLAVTILDPNTIRYELERSVWLAMHGRKGPVWIDIPLDVQAAQVEPSELPCFVPPTPPVADIQSDVEAIIHALHKAKRPVIYAGNGVRAANQVGTFRELVSKLGAPVLLTWKSVDLLAEDSPEYIGRPGGIGQRAANFTQQKADLLLVLGARLDRPSVAFNDAGVAPHAHKIIVDIDEAELAKMSVPYQHTIHADLADILPVLLKSIGTADSHRQHFASWLATSRAW